MKIQPFDLEQYFAKYEFSTKYLLSSSDCDGLSQSEVLSWADDETRELWNNLKLSYTEPRGLPLLREEIAKLYKNISADNTLVVVPEEGIFIALNTILQKGDHVVCTWPGYQSLYEICTSIGCEVGKWEPTEDGVWKFDIASLREQICPNTKLLIINLPHNPTGFVPSKEDFQKIIELAKEHGLYIFSDEMYRFLEFDNEKRLPSACEVYDKAVSLFGMSKTFGMAGVRIGWLVTKDRDLQNKMATFKDYTTICSSAPSEVLAVMGLRAKDTIVPRHLKRISRNLLLLDVFFEKNGHLFGWTRPTAGTIGFVKILFSEGADAFCERVVREAGIMLLPSTVYGYGNEHFRIGFGRENMPEVLEKLEEYLKINPPNELGGKSR